MTLPAVVEQYDDGARRAVSLSREEAHRLGHKQVGTEHLLLGLLRVQGGPAYRALTASGVTVEAARRKAIEAVGTLGADPASEGPEDPPFSARASRALERATRFAAQRRLAEVGSGQLLLAVLDVEGTAGQVLRGLAVDVGRLGEVVGGLLERPSGSTVGDASGGSVGDDRHETAGVRDTPSPHTGGDRAASRPEAVAGSTSAAGAAGGRGPAAATSGRASSTSPAPAPPLRAPRCSSCASPLEGSLALRPMTPRKGGMRREVLVAYCAVCGSTFGVMPA